MNYASTFLLVATAASLLACGKSEDLPAPATQPPAAEIPQTAAAPEPVAPVVDIPLVESAPAVQPEIAIGQTAAASKPAPAPAPVPPAPKPASAAAATAAEVPAPSTPAPDLAHGQQIYRQACAFCHDKGVAGAPKTGDVAAWSPRLAQGMDALYTVALRGKGAMPAKGGNPSLSDTDVRASVDYLVEQAR